MLAYRWHRHFAKKLFRPWGERRVLAFATSGTGGDAGDEDNLEEANKNVEDLHVPENSTQQEIGTIAKKMRSKMEMVKPLLKKAALHPFVLGAGISILKRLHPDNEEIDPNVVSIIEKSERYLEAEREGKDIDPLRKELSEDIGHMMDRPDIAFALAKAFEQRMEHYHELERMIGSKPESLARLVKLEHDLRLQGDANLETLSSPDMWTEEHLDAILEEIGLNPTTLLSQNSDNLSREERKARDFCLQVDTSAIRSEDGKPTKELKLQMLYNAVISARKIGTLEKADIGTETTLQNTKEIKRILFKQMLRSRRHLESTIMLKAMELGEQWSKLREHITDGAGTTDDDAIARYLGMSLLAFRRRRSEIDHTLQCALRVSKLKENPDDLTSKDIDDSDNLRKASDTEFTGEAEKLLAELSNLDWLGITQMESRVSGFRGLDAHDRKAEQAWASSRARRLETAESMIRSDPSLKEHLAELLNFGPETDLEEQLQGMHRHAEVCTRVRDGSVTAEDYDHLHENLSKERRTKLDRMLLAVESPSFLSQLRRDKKLLQKSTVPNAEQTRDAITEELDATVGTLFESGIGSAPKHPLLRHETCAALHVPEQLSTFITGIDRQMKSLVHMKGAKADELLRACALHVQKLTKTVAELNHLQGRDARTRIRSIPPKRITEYEEVARTTKTAACYNRTDGVIYINESMIRSGEHRQAVLHHEQGHAIVDTLVHRVGVLPMLFVALHETLAEEMPGDIDSRTFDDLLSTRENAWHISALRTPIYRKELAAIERRGGTDRNAHETLATQRTNAQIKELLMDELINKYATWTHSGKSAKGFAPQDIQLFSCLEGEKEQNPVAFDTEQIAKSLEPNIALQISEDEMADIFAKENPEHSGSSPKISVSNVGQKISDAQDQLGSIYRFIRDHNNTEGIEEFTAWTDEWRDAFEERIKNPFYEFREGEDSDQLEKRLGNLLGKLEKDFFTPATKQMNAVKKAEIEKGSEAKGSKGLWQTLRGIEFASINDVISMCKSVGEDLQRMWKRRGERVQSVLGQSITSWIPDNNLWGLSYAGQLKHEFQRRSSASELSEVQQWKDALKDLDSFSLQDMLRTSRTKDQVRALCELLIEKGRLNFNDEKFWDTLMFFSGIKMPKDACRNNSILRDKWLQRMVTEIWSDKDKFYDWRQSNDNGIRSGKEKFTQVCDQLSNIRGGLAGTLERQLRLWTKGKQTGSIPEEVNPHLYEKILHYAMGNGKMSMEDKLFYLVQGCRHGLISIERLQALAGEDGGVLNKFPLIDYFTTHNNTLPELEEIGNRIQEDADHFVPGQKTTLWIHNEVIQNSEARARMSKAMSGERMQELDHEDIPTLAAIMDYKNVEEITGLLSGDRFKISYEAAKNWYTGGGGTAPKILARKAQLHKKGLARFTDQDCVNAARMITAYTHFDNIVTGNAYGGKRIEVTLDQMDQSGAPSTGKHTVKEFRTPMHNFVREILKNSNIGWGQGNLKNVTLDSYIRSEEENNSNAIIYAEERKKDNYKATGDVQKQLTAALLANKPLLINILASHADNFLEEGGVRDLSEAKVEHYYSAMKNRGIVPIHAGTAA